jgi:hypothetical protein
MATIFLATVLGWFLVIVSFFLLFKHQHMKLIMADVIGHTGLFFVFALITLIIGLLMVTSHNIWVMGWPVVVTLFSWIILLSGLLRLMWPEVAMQMGQSFFRHPIRMQATGGVLLIIGLFLLFHAYRLHG